MIEAVIRGVTQHTGQDLSEEQLVSIYQQLTDYEACFTPPSADVQRVKNAHQSAQQREAKRLTIFDYIRKYGHDEDFDPSVKCPPSFSATGARAGTAEKKEVFAQRVREGLPLWHNDDPVCYRGVMGDLQALLGNTGEKHHSNRDSTLDCSLFPPRPEGERNSK